MTQLTPSQEAAVRANGNVLVEAGAGTGKTRTLVERCLNRMADPDSKRRIPLQDMLIVTFTEAAAAEMRHRIRTALESRCATSGGDDWWAEQLASVDLAWISTLHSFCLSIVREHFHEVGLDPLFRVLPQDQTHALEQESLNWVFRQPEQAARIADLCRWSRERGRGAAARLRDHVTRLFHYSQSLRNPPAWFARELHHLERPAPERWLALWPECYSRWRARWRETLEAQGETAFEDCLRTPIAPGGSDSKTGARAELELLRSSLPAAKGLSKPSQKHLKSFTQEIDYLLGLQPESPGDTPDGAEPAPAWRALSEDWEGTRGPMAGLLRLTQAFGKEYARRKDEAGGVDFHDLEQIALRLLWDFDREAPTALANRWRQRVQLLLIDEYQDINEAQDAILLSLARPAPEGNRFLVGDIKQSIYRFRLANPRIFQSYARQWRPASEKGQVLRLTENFRGHPEVLDFVNRCFTGLMRESTGGVDYGEESALRAGAPDRIRFRTPAGTEGAGFPRIELRLLMTDSGTDEEDESDGATESALSSLELEARLIGLRLLESRTALRPVWDESLGAHRAIEWGDMAILLRSPREKAESFAKEFAKLGIPLAAARGGFYDALEVADWLNLLRLLDNPLQDLPLLAVLRSPIASFSDEHLATVRVAQRTGLYWTALMRFAQTGAAGSLKDRAVEFLARHARWRQMARVTALSECLSRILDETLYETWLATQPRGPQRLANLRRLLGLTRQFDQFQRQGLFRFLRFVEAQVEAELDTEPAATEAANAVRLLSIHQSKGLEFPLVVVADLAKPFNESDLRGSLILDETWGLCPTVRSPVSGRHYPSLAHWFARRHQREELAGEEMRLLYVALTRARDYLILTAKTSAKRAAGWEEASTQPLSDAQAAGARSFLDWLGPRCARLAAPGSLGVPGESNGFAWFALSPAEVADAVPPLPHPSFRAGERAEPDSVTLSEETIEVLQERLAWPYPWTSATTDPAKTSVSAWRRRVVEENDHEAYPLFTEPARAEPSAEGSVHPNSARPLAATDIGTAHHAFLENVRLDRTGSLSALQQEAEHMVETGVLTSEESAAVNLEAIAGFWASDLGRRVLGERACIRRELPFTARFSTAELHAWFARTLPPNSPEDRGDFIIVQGVVDLALIRERDLWVIDYKTDRVDEQGVENKARAYAPQLGLYATALGRIYRRPATEAWLYFLSLGRAVPVPLAPASAD